MTNLTNLNNLTNLTNLTTYSVSLVWKMSFSPIMLGCSSCASTSASRSRLFMSNPGTI